MVNGACVTTYCQYGVNANGTACVAAPANNTPANNTPDTPDTPDTPAVTCVNTADKIKKMVNGICVTTPCAYGVAENGTVCNTECPKAQKVVVLDGETYIYHYGSNHTVSGNCTITSTWHI